MSNLWTPDMASPRLEELMEARDLPEEDRDELRRFAEVLGRRKKVRDGEVIPPAPDGMRQWIMGDDNE